MNDWIKRLFHCHIWVVLRRGTITMNNKFYGFYYDVQCKECGKIKSFET